MNAAALAHSVWRRKVLALVLALVTALAGAAFLAAQDEVYESEVTVALLPRPDVNGSTSSSRPLYPEAVRSLLPTYTQVVESGIVLERVAARLGPSATVADLKESVFVRTVPDTAVLIVVAQAPSAATSARTAQLTAEEFVNEIAGDDVLAGQILDSAQEPTAPVAPNRPLAALAIALVALVLGALGAVVFDRLFGRVESAQEAEKATGLPVLGVLGTEKELRGRAPRLAVDDQAFPELTAELRAVQANLQFALRDKAHRAIAVTSAHTGEGKSTFVANLGLTLAQYGRETLILDADLASPAQSSIFGLPAGVGPSEAALEGDDLHDVMYSGGHPRLRVVPGDVPAPEHSRVASSYFRQLPRFADLADVVIIDTPALDSGADARLLAASAGAVMLVVKAGSPTPRRLKDLVESFAKFRVEVLGLVLVQGRRGASAAPTRLTATAAPSAPSAAGGAHLSGGGERTAAKASRTAAGERSSRD